MRIFTTLAIVAIATPIAHADTYGPQPSPILTAAVARMCADPNAFAEARRACDTGQWPTVTSDGARFSNASRFGKALNTAIGAYIAQAIASN